MTVPPDAEPDKYDIRFIYEKDGVQREFTLNDYPADDTTWKFVDQKSVLISRGYVPPIHDFTLITENGIDMTDQVTRHQGSVLLMIARRLGDADRDGLMKGYSLGMDLREKGVDFHIVTATAPAEAAPLVTGFSALYADETTLKTIIRSNPGFVLINNGTVAAKWSYHNLPDNDRFSGDLNAMAFRMQEAAGNRLVAITAILAVLLSVALTLPFRFKP